MRPTWSCELPSPPLGLSLAREANVLLAFDAERTFTRVDRRGQVELRRPTPATVTAAVLSDEGRHVAALGRRGQAWLLSAEFDVIWQRSPPQRPVALALDHLGRAVAVADEAGGLHVFDQRGQQLWRCSVPRPLVHLAYVAEAGVLVGAADLGLVCAFDRWGRCLWREGLMTNVGSLGVSGDGGRIVLACFSEGVSVSSLEKPHPRHLPQTGACRLAAVAYRGQPILCVGLDNRLTLRDAEGRPRGEWTPPAPPAAVALAALGEWAAVLCERSVLGLDLSEPHNG